LHTVSSGYDELYCRSGAWRHLLKRCLHYHTCTAYMYAEHVRRTCVMNVYTVAHVYNIHIFIQFTAIKSNVRRACATYRYTSYTCDVHIRRTCTSYMYVVYVRRIAHVRRTCTSYMCDVHIRRTCKRCLHYHTCTAYMYDSVNTALVS